MDLHLIPLALWSYPRPWGRPAGYEHGRSRSVGQPALTKPLFQFRLFPPCQPIVGPDEDREQHQRRQGRPLDQKPDDDEQKASVLRVTHVLIQAIGDEFTFRLPGLPPTDNHEREPEEDQCCTDGHHDGYAKLQWQQPKPGEQHCPEVALKHTKSEVDPEHGTQEVDRERCAEHFGKQRHQVGLGHTQVSPRTPLWRSQERQDSEGKEGDSKDHSAPIAVPGLVCLHRHISIGSKNRHGKHGEGTGTVRLSFARS